MLQNDDWQPAHSLLICGEIVLPKRHNRSQNINLNFSVRTKLPIKDTLKEDNFPTKDNLKFPSIHTSYKLTSERVPPLALYIRQKVGPEHVHYSDILSAK